MSRKSDDYDEKYIKIKLDSDDKLPLNKTMKIPIMVIVVRAIFYENNIMLSTSFLRWISVQNIKMLYYDRIDVSEGIGINKTRASKESARHYWYSLNYSFKFQSNICNRSHDLLMMSINLSDIAILNIKGSDYHCIISLISKMRLSNWCKTLIWPEKVKHYKT